MRPLRRTIAGIDLPLPALPVVTPDFRAAFALGVFAVGFLVVASFGELYLPGTHIMAKGHYRVLRIIGTAGFAVCGVYGVRRAGREAYRVLTSRLGLGHSAVVRWVLTVAGYLVVGFTVLSLLSVNVGSLLLGGAITGVVVGIAAQQSLGNVFAGVVLLLSRPFIVGDEIRLQSGALAGELCGLVTGMGLTYVALLTEEGPMAVPNAQVLNAAVGPRPPLDPGPPV